MDLLSVTLTLLLIIVPLGNIQMFLSILNKIPDENRRRKILIRELFLALLVLLIFLFLGRHLLQWLNLQPQSENRGRDCPFSDRNKNDLSSSFRRHHGAIP